MDDHDIANGKRESLLALFIVSSVVFPTRSVWLSGATDAICVPRAAQGNGDASELGAVN